MDYKLIADAGSTKIDWVLLSNEGKKEAELVTPGLNALLATESEATELFGNASSKLYAGLSEAPEGVEVSYYGAGCATTEICDRIATSIRQSFRARDVMVASDLLGAARSLHGRNRGIACILGTGSNSCLYNGSEIEHNVPSLGYVLGDEGSGAALGKRLVADAFKGHLPEIIREKFTDTYKMTIGDILDRVYKQPGANRFLASLVPFIAENIWNPYLYSLVRKEFESFLERNVSQYEGAHTLPIAFTGSIAWHFSDILREAATNAGFTPGEITSHPLEGLIKYHSQS